MSRNAPICFVYWCWLIAGLGFCLPDGLAATSAATAENRTRLVVVHDDSATTNFLAVPDTVRKMVQKGVTALSGKATVAEAWRSYVKTQDVVGIKVYSVPGPNSGTRPSVVAAVVEGLLAAGLPPRNIVVWDRHTTDLRLAGFYELEKKYGVRVAGSLQAGYDPAVSYESPLIGNLVWGDLEFGRKEGVVGRKSFVSLLITKEITRIINITPLLNQNLAGVSGNLFGLASGSVDNFTRFESDPERLATAVPEICALPALFDKVALNIVDGLICQYAGGERSLLHYSSSLNELRFSRDMVALDKLSLEELKRQRMFSTSLEGPPATELYSNATLLELGNDDKSKMDSERVEVR